MPPPLSPPNQSSPVTRIPSKPLSLSTASTPSRRNRGRATAPHWAPLASVQPILHTEAGGMFSKHTALVTSSTHARTQTHTVCTLLKTSAPFPKDTAQVAHVAPGWASSGLSTHTPSLPPLSSCVLEFPPTPRASHTLPAARTRFPGCKLSRHPALLPQAPSHLLTLPVRVILGGWPHAVSPGDSRHVPGASPAQ